ncbi:phosphoribosylglycinamide formyltransferase [Bacillus sp. B1-b2]|uniref:phosphoribosylglycinamide formyltransferase n=1 Tax=Bacillus sp. B1-b2 TaxID=2653201 RepID=UPI001261DDEB|nr:phosphoribosylglycinamide formyltransferase [Bacillus sp. B1-b2]KAB7672442.1 phosphoribosylglycinamide formyltransferase [Bacillus sp. B1-b2]
MKRLAIFASGSGSNFQAIVNAVKNGNLSGSINLLVCDQKSAYCIDRAAKASIPSFVFTAKNYPNKEEYEKEILQYLIDKEIDLIVLAGYMRLIGNTLLQAYSGRIINVHPSLLPSFPGKDAIGQALEAGVEQTGITIHYVDEGMDTGPIIAQQAIQIDRNESRESLQEKIHALEHQLYPKVIQQLLNEDQIENQGV